MSLFVFQQKIPFQSVIRWLRYYAPGGEMPAADWASGHAADIAPGDMLFIWEPIYSPWGDASSGIGVADGDSFKVSQMFFVTKWENNAAFGYNITPDTYKAQTVASYLEECVNTAKGNGIGFYFSLVRSNPALTEDKLKALEGMDSYGASGWRSEDAAAPDFPYAYFANAGYGTEMRTGMVLQIDQLGFALFCDKDPPPTSGIPDIRRFTAPVYKESRRENTGGGAAAPIEQPAADAPAPSLPKMPSFFSQGGAKRVNNPLGGGSPFGGAQGGAVPPAPMWDEPAAEAPPVESVGAEADAAPTADVWAAPPDAAPTADVWAAPPMDTPPEMVAAEAELPVESSAPEPAQQASAASPAPQIMWGLDEEENVEAPAEAPAEVPNVTAASEDPSSSVTTIEEALPVTPPSVPKVGKAPRIVPPRPSGGLPPVPSKSLPPIPEGMNFNTPEPVAEDIAPEVVEEDEKPDLKITTEIDPSQLPVYLQEQPKQPGVEDIMAAIETSIRETAEQKKQEGDKPTTSRVRPGRGQQAEAKPEAKPEQPQQQPQTEEPVADIPPLPPKKKKPDPAEIARAQEIAKLKEPIAVKSGVAGLVSKLEQQASKASARLETQVEDIQTRLNEELAKLLGKVNTSEKRSNKSAEGLRLNLTTKMEGVANGVKEQIAQATAEGIENIKSHDGTGQGQLDDKHEYLRMSLTGSFDEVKARAETVAKSFEESLNTQSQDMLSSLEEMRENLRSQFSELESSYLGVLQAAYENYKDRIGTVMEAATTVVENRQTVLDAQLADLRERHLKGLEHCRSMLLSKLGRQFVVAETDLVKLQTSALEETLLPKLKQHREELRVVTSEFQHKLSQDLDEKGEQKISEFQPVLEEKKAKLLELLNETTTVKDSIQEQLKGRLEGIFVQLKEFVDKSIEEAEEAFDTTEEELGEIDRAIRALADPSTIEGDLELLNERNTVLARLDEITETSKENVLNTLRSNLAALEERGKLLQEELISSMEEDAYVVRRASEQSLIQIREAIRDSFVAIQTAQDERMPM